MIVYYNGGYDLIIQTITNQGFISHSSTKKTLRTQYVEYMFLLTVLKNGGGNNVLLLLVYYFTTAGIGVCLTDHVYTFICTSH